MPLMLPLLFPGPLSDCKDCQSDVMMEEADEYEDFSFDLCFGCANLPPPEEFPSPYRMLVTAATSNRDEAMTPFSKSYPPDGSMLHPSAGSFLKKEAPVATDAKEPNQLTRPKTKEVEIAFAQDDAIIVDDVAEEPPAHVKKSRGPARFSKSKTSHHNASHQLVAVAQDCLKCAKDTSISMKCTEDDCEFSFDLCFECAGTGPLPPRNRENKTALTPQEHADPDIDFDHDFETFFSIG
jgi:hypothetical protein